MNVKFNPPRRATTEQDANRLIQQIPAGTQTLILDLTNTRVEGPFLRTFINTVTRQGLDKLVLVGLNGRMRDYIKFEDNPAAPQIPRYAIDTRIVELQ